MLQGKIAWENNVDRTWQNVAEHDKMLQNMTKYCLNSAKLNEGPLPWRLLESLAMVEIPQGTLPSPPQEENGRNQGQQWQATPLCDQRRNKQPEYSWISWTKWHTMTYHDIPWHTMTYHDLCLIKSCQINIFKDLQSYPMMSHVKITSSNRNTQFDGPFTSLL